MPSKQHAIHKKGTERSINDEILIEQYVARSYLKGMAAAKHRRLRGNIRCNRKYGGSYSCVMMWTRISKHCF